MTRLSTIAKSQVRRGKRRYKFLNDCIIKYIEDIYFFEVNAKYISSKVLKISVISRVLCTREITDIFNI